MNTFASIEKWELAIRQYQDMSGLVIDDQTKMAALVKNLQNEEMKDHLIMQSASLKTYADMRAEIERVGTIRDSMLDSSMDLSGFGKGAKGGKNQSKGDKSSKGCYKCGKKGHFATDCRRTKRKAYDTQGKSKCNK